MSEFDESLPEWAIGFANNRMQPGALLPTRDGRIMGNATVIQIDYHESLGQPVATIITDAGNELRMTERELEEIFHKPKWLKKVSAS